MATISGTIKGITLVNASGTRKSYILTADFAAYTGASDTAAIAGVGAAITAQTRNGKTNTLVTGTPAVSCGAGRDTNGQAVFFGGTIAKSTDDITSNLCDASGTELTSSTAAVGVQVLVVVDES